MRPRIPAALALAAALAATTSAHAFEVKHAEGGELVRWKRAKVVWTVDRTMNEVPGGEAAVRGAIKAWTQRAGAPKLAVARADAVLEVGYDGTNAVVFAKDGFAPAGNALAITVLSFDDASGEVLDADIILNGKYTIGTVDAETYDVGRIVAHEMGHGLGLSDELARKDALMYPYVARAVVLGHAPGTDDLAGLKTLYDEASASPSEAATDGSGCGGAVVARTGPRSAPGGVLCAAGLVIAAIAMARGRRRGGRAAAGCTVIAAAVLVMPPLPERASASPIAAEVDAEAVVTAVHTTAEHGLFRSEVETATTRCVSGRCPATSRSVVWGGTLDGVRQVVGTTRVPVAGERVGIIHASRTSAACRLVRISE